MTPGLAENPELELAKIGKLTFFKEVPIPLMAANIAGIATKLIMDTGADELILTSHFAKKLGMEVTQHAKYPLTVIKDQPLSIRIGELELGPMEEVMVLNRPNTLFEKEEVGAIFNPHIVSCEHCFIVLDFLNKEFYFAHSSSDEELIKGMDALFSDMPRITADYVKEKNALLYISGVSINNQKPGTVLMDTGAGASFFTKKSLGPDVKIVKAARAMNAAGKMRKVDITAPVPIKINGVTVANIPVRVEEFRSKQDEVTNGDWESIPNQGELGMDVLKNCVVAIERRKAVHFYCKLPKESEILSTSAR